MFNSLNVDAKIAGNVVSQFATTLQSMVAYKMKTVICFSMQFIPIPIVTTNNYILGIRFRGSIIEPFTKNGQE
jgi:hypothetical protein